MKKTNTNPSLRFRIFGQRPRGFTFIEILVVVTIIAILTTIAVVSYQSVSKRSRDAKRLSDLEQVRAALELCRSEEGSYPLSINFSNPSSGLVCGTNTYLNPLPKDPKDGQSAGGSAIYRYVYAYQAATQYVLCGNLEDVTQCATGTVNPCCFTSP